MFFSVFDPNATYEHFTEATRNEDEISVMQFYEIYCLGVCVNVTLTTTRTTFFNGRVMNPGGTTYDETTNCPLLDSRLAVEKNKCAFINIYP